MTNQESFILALPAHIYMASAMPEPMGLFMAAFWACAWYFMVMTEAKKEDESD